MRSYLLIIAAAMWATPGMAAEASRHISVKEALDIVSSSHPQVRASRARMEAARWGARARIGKLLPNLHVSDAQSWYWTNINVDKTLLPPTFNPATLAAFPDDLRMNMFSVSASQPLLGLLRISQDYASSDDAADASVEDYKASTADVRANVRTYFLRLFEARALADTAAASQKDLEEQVDVAKKKMDAGALTTADVLRLQVAAANAKQQVIAAHGQEVSLRAALLETLGLGNDDGSVDFVEPTELQQITAPPDLKKAREDALRLRPELASAHLNASAAEHRKWSKTWALLPELNVSASWMRVDVAPFNYKVEGHTINGNVDVGAGNVGLNASWGVWEWGSTWFERDEAEANAVAAQAQVDGVAVQVGSEVAARHSDLVAAASAVDVANTQVASAEEAYRVMQALSNAGSATTTDLLDAQSALTSARMGLVRAKYEAAVASVALQRATGGE